MIWGEPIETGNKCPDWLKPDEPFAYTNAFGEWAERAPTDSWDCRTWHWEHIGQIKLPEGHWAYRDGLVSPDRERLRFLLKIMRDHASYSPFPPDDKLFEEVDRFIEQHEHPPVDPDVLAVREILEAWVGPHHFHLSADHAAYLADIPVDFQAALAAYRRRRNV